MSKFIYGGYILTGGTLQDGKPWQGVNIMLAQCKETNAGVESPTYAQVFKASRLDSIMNVLNKLVPGEYVIPYFGVPQLNSKGQSVSKIVELRPDEN